jgi:hypothetical protein
MAMGIRDPHSIYNGACVYARLGMKTEAMETLERASDAGYGEAEAAARDPDLACLHGEPAFEDWLRRLRNKR